MLSATTILSASIAKRLQVEQDRFLKRSKELRVASFNETASYKFLYYELRVANCVLKLELQFNKTFDTSSC